VGSCLKVPTSDRVYYPYQGLNFEIPPSAKNKIYQLALKYYNLGNYVGALQLFLWLGNYQGAPQYVELLKEFFEAPPTDSIKKEPTVRVLLGRNFQEVIIQNGRTYKVVVLNKKFLFKGKEYKNLHLEIQKPVYLTVVGNNYRRTYPVKGNLTFINRGGENYLILSLPLEEYLKGVLPKEVYPSWPIEALKAQAVAARTYALYNILKNKNKPYDVDSTTLSQVFGGVFIGKRTTDLAVEQTRGQILTHDGRVIYAMYSSNNAPCTHSFKELLKIDLPYLEKVKDIYSLKAPKWVSWERKVPKEVILKKLHKYGFELLQIEDIKITKTNGCKRVLWITLEGKYKKITLPVDFFFRYLLRLPSDSFFITGKSGKYITFTGIGFGHGLGMSQWGAYVMAKEGKSYREILSFYYPHTKLERVY
jgi:stage II sporulation protein D